MKLVKRITSCFLSFAVAVTMMCGLFVVETWATVTYNTSATVQYALNDSLDIPIRSIAEIREVIHNIEIKNFFIYPNYNKTGNSYNIGQRYPGEGRCLGYAHHVFAEIFGFPRSDEWVWNGPNCSRDYNTGLYWEDNQARQCKIYGKNLIEVGDYDNGSILYNNEKAINIFKKAKIGDIIQANKRHYTGNAVPHTMIIIKIDLDNNTLRYLDCNGDGANTISVSNEDISFEKFISGNLYKYEKFRIYRSINYPPDDFQIENGVLTGYTGTDKDITIPSGVTEIGERAFACNDTIKRVTIPKNVKKIGFGAFSYCQNLKYVDFQSGYGQEVGDSAFEGCGNLLEVKMSDSVDSIGMGAFAGCGFYSFTIPNSITKIGGCAFADCPNLTKIFIPWNVREIGIYAFAAPNIEEIKVHENNQYFKDDNGVLYTKDETRLFAYPAANGRIAYDILTGTKYITSGAFKYCKNLKHIFLPNTVRTIDIEAFNECYSLTEITIPKSVVEIQSYSDTGDYGPFGNCKNLKNIYVDSGNPCYKDIDGVLYSKDGTVLIAYPIGRISLMYSIPSGVTKIGTGSSPFTGCISLKYLFIPDSVNSFAVSAFMKSRGLFSISIPKGITKLPDSIFGGCSSLISIDIPYGVKSIGNFAFCDCTNLKSVTIPSSVTSIGEAAFANCPNLKNIYFAGSRTKWDSIAGDAASYLPSGCSIVGMSGLIWKSVIACPVDVEIYNSSNELVGRVVNNEVDESVTSVTIFVDDETSTKYITAPGNNTYSIKAIGYDSGTMDYSISIVSLDEETPEQEYSVEGIVITPNTVVESTSDNSAGIDVVATMPSDDHDDYVVDYKIDENNNVTVTDNAVSHHYSNEWKYDGKSHWHECSCGKRIDEQEHDSLVECSICGYKCKHTDCIDVITYPTVSSQGYTTHTCNVCGTVFVDTYTEYVPLVVNSEVNSAYELVLDWTGYDDAVGYEVDETINGESHYLGFTTEKTFTVIPESAGNHTYVVTAYFDEKTAISSSGIMVTNPERVVSDITVTPPTKTTYYVGEPINLNGGALTVSYNYGVSKTINITSDMIESFDNTEAGDADVTVTYGGVSKTFAVKVKNKSIVDMFISSLPSVSAVLGKELNLTNGKIEVWYDYGEPDEIDMTSSMISGYDNTTLGQQTITVIFEGFTDTFEVTVLENSKVEGTEITVGTTGCDYKSIYEAITAINKLIKAKTADEAYNLVVSDGHIEKSAITIPKSDVKFAITGGKFTMNTPKITANSDLTLSCAIEPSKANTALSIIAAEGKKVNVLGLETSCKLNLSGTKTSDFILDTNSELKVTSLSTANLEISKGTSVVLDKATFKPTNLSGEGTIEVKNASTLTIADIDKTNITLHQYEKVSGKTTTSLLPKITVGMLSDVTLTVKDPSGNLADISGQSIFTLSVASTDRFLTGITAINGDEAIKAVPYSKDVRAEKLDAVELTGVAYSSFEKAFEKINEDAKAADKIKPKPAQPYSSYEITMKKDAVLTKFALPAKTASITINGGGNKLELVGVTSITPKYAFALSNISINAHDKNNKPAALTINASSVGAVSINDLTFAGKSLTINSSKDTTTIDGITLEDGAPLTIKGGSKNNVTITDCPTVNAFSGFVTTTLTDDMTVEKSFSTDNLDLGTSGNLILGNDPAAKKFTPASVTIKKLLTGETGSKITLSDGFKPITISGNASGSIALTGIKVPATTQILNSSKCTLGTFDVTEIQSGTGNYALTRNSAKVYCQPANLDLDGVKFVNFADVVNEIENDGKAVDYTVTLDGDYANGAALKFPKAGTYALLSIDLDDHKFTFTGNITLTGTTVIEDGPFYAEKLNNRTKEYEPVRYTISSAKDKSLTVTSVDLGMVSSIGLASSNITLNDVTLSITQPIQIKAKTFEFSSINGIIETITANSVKADGAQSIKLLEKKQSKIETGFAEGSGNVAIMIVDKYGNAVTKINDKTVLFTKFGGNTASLSIKNSGYTLNTDSKGKVTIVKT